MNKIYIGNLPPTIDRIKLEALFALCGPILSSEVIKYTDQSHSPFDERAYGFITFENSEGARRVSWISFVRFLPLYKMSVSVQLKTNYRHVYSTGRLLTG